MNKDILGNSGIERKLIVASGVEGSSGGTLLGNSVLFVFLIDVMKWDNVLLGSREDSNEDATIITKSPVFVEIREAMDEHILFY